MPFWSNGNDKVKPRRARKSPVAEFAAKVFPSLAQVFLLVAVALAFMVGDTQATSAGTDVNASPSASAVSEGAPSTTETNYLSSASLNSAPIPIVAKSVAPVKAADLKKVEDFAPNVVKKTVQPSSTPSARPKAPQRVSTKVSAKPKAPQRASKAPRKAVETKKASTPRRRPAKVTAASTGSSKGLRALAYARAQIGEPYRMNAAGPGAWDCSGLTMKAWGSVGVNLPHSAHRQLNYGRRVSKANLRKGDLVFFYSPIHHVGIYAGNGKVLHASRPGKPVGYLPMKYMPFSGASRPG